MKNKGFTLTELLAILVIIGLISVIVVPNIANILQNQRDKLYIKQVNQIVEIAENWASKNLSQLSTDGSVTYISIDTLIKEENLKTNDIIDPRTEQPMDGCVSIMFDLEYKQYDINFLSTSDNNYKNECNNSI